MRIGILGTAHIARKNIKALKRAPGVFPKAVGSRNIERAQRYAAETGLEQAYGTYAQVVEHPELEALYVPLPTVLHREWVGRAVDAGKHVLVEKPVALNAAELDQMLQRSLRGVAGRVGLWMQGVSESV